MSRLQIRLWNGATTREAWNPDSPEFIDGSKPEERVLHAASVRVPYGSLITMDGIQGLDEFPDENPLQLEWDVDDLIELEGVFYGDIEILSAPTTHDPETQ